MPRRKDRELSCIDRAALVPSRRCHLVKEGDIERIVEPAGVSANARQGYVNELARAFRQQKMLVPHQAVQEVRRATKQPPPEVRRIVSKQHHLKVAAESAGSEVRGADAHEVPAASGEKDKLWVKYTASGASDGRDLKAAKPSCPDLPEMSL
jgi:hypothetical protein